MLSFKRRPKSTPAVPRCAACGTPSVVQVVDLAANTESGYCRTCGHRWESAHRRTAELVGTPA